MKKFSQSFVFALAGLGALALPQIALSYTGSAPEFSPSQEIQKPNLVANESCDGDVCKVCDPFLGCEVSDDAKVISPSQPVVIQPPTPGEEPSTPTEEFNDDTAPGTTGGTTYAGTVPVAENFDSAAIGGGGCSLSAFAGTTALDSGWLSLLLLAGIPAFRKKK